MNGSVLIIKLLFSTTNTSLLIGHRKTFQCLDVDVVSMTLSLNLGFINLHMTFDTDKKKLKHATFLKCFALSRLISLNVIYTKSQNM